MKGSQARVVSRLLTCKDLLINDTHLRKVSYFCTGTHRIQKTFRDQNGIIGSRAYWQRGYLFNDLSKLTIEWADMDCTKIRDPSNDVAVVKKFGRGNKCDDPEVCKKIWNEYYK